jgi:hypothetical protein
MAKRISAARAPTDDAIRHRPDVACLSQAFRKEALARGGMFDSDEGLYQEIVRQGLLVKNRPRHRDLPGQRDQRRAAGLELRGLKAERASLEELYAGVPRTAELDGLIVACEAKLERHRALMRTWHPVPFIAERLRDCRAARGLPKMSKASIGETIAALFTVLEIEMSFETILDRLYRPQPRPVSIRDRLTGAE